MNDIEICENCGGNTDAYLCDPCNLALEQQCVSRCHAYDLYELLRLRGLRDAVADELRRLVYGVYSQSGREAEWTRCVVRSLSLAVERSMNMDVLRPRKVV